MPQEEECNIKKILNYLLKLQEDLENTPLTKEASGNNNNEDVGEGSEQKSSEVSEGSEKKSSEAIEGSEKKISEASKISEKKSPTKRASWIGRFNRLCKTKDKGSSHGRDSGGSQGGSTSIGNVKNNKQSAELEVRKLKSDIRQMINAFTNLTDFQNEMSKSLRDDRHLNKLKVILDKASSINSQSHDLKEIRRKVFTLKSQIPSLLYKQTSREMMISEDSQITEDYSVISETGADIYLPSLHVSEDFRKSSAFEEVVDKFQELEFNHKLCLLSFAVFPENREVNRTMLKYWWIGEDYISCDGSENGTVKKILDGFSTKGLLETVEDETNLKPSCYKMEPHVHSAVIHLAKFMDLFKLYDDKGKSNYRKTERGKVCLVRRSSLQQDTKTRKMEPEKLETVFNSSERYPDFTFKWFPSMKSLKVLYLGRWERTAKRHIEVESTEFLKDIKELKKVKLVSFQGISRIEKLENPICLLPKLVILDLKACYNLETLPSDIGLLQSLIYLDVSDCYMLDGMPKGISKLSTLQVLKGFVIGESDDERNCAVKHLKELRKLSITVNRYSFKVENLAESLKGLKHLQSLKIAWGAQFPDTDQKDEKSEENNEAEEYKETTNEENERQGGTPTDKKHKDQVEKKEQKSEDRKGDGVSNKKEEANLEEKKKHENVKAESLKSDKVVEGEKKANPSQEATETIQNKPDDQERKSNVEGDGDKGKVDLEEGKKKDEVNSESLKSEKAASPSREETEKPKLQKVAGSPPEETETIQNKPDNQEVKTNVQGDEDKGKVDPEEGKNKDEVGAEILKSDKVFEGEKKASPPQDVSDMIQEKPDDKSKVEKKGDGPDKEKADLDGGKKQTEVEAKRTTSPPQESKDTIDDKTDDKSKGKADPEEGKKHNEAEAGISRSNNGVEGVKKASSARESTEEIRNKPDHHEIGDKQEEKGDEEKKKANLEEGKKKDEVEADSSKADKVIEESKKIVQSKPDDHREISKVQEKGDGEKKGDNLKMVDEGEAKTQKSHKAIKFGKILSFSGKSKALIQKKRDDLKGDNEMTEENYETPSPSRPTKDSKSNKAKWFKEWGQQTKRWGTGSPDNPVINHTSKLPSTLKKLELECFPEEDPPKWLNPKDLNNLEKLSIKGGWLSGINNEDPTAENKWTVQILRLKYLHKFKVKWKDLQTQFPEMTLLEKYECPKIAFCPTDGNGVWRKPQLSPNM